jgi:hypothetical protein
MTTTRDEQVKAQRPVRVPLGARNRMTVDGLKDTKDFVYRWVNDTNQKPQACIAAGWVFVGKNGLTVGDVDVETGKGIGSVEVKYVGQGIKSYLMKQDRKTWELDRKARVDDPTNSSEQAQMSDSANNAKGLNRGGISISQGRSE